jgi:hypothetical protein
MTEAWAAPVPRITRQQQTAACSRSARTCEKYVHELTCVSLCAPDLLPRLRGYTLAASAPLKHWRVPLTVTTTFPICCPLIPARGLTVGVIPYEGRGGVLSSGERDVSEVAEPEGDVEWHVGLCFMAFNRHVMWFAAALWPLLENVARLQIRCETKTKTYTTSYWKLCKQQESNQRCR